MDRYNIIFDKYNIKNMIKDLLDVLIIVNPDHKLYYIIKKPDNIKECDCGISGCERYAYYYDIINDKSLCWYHSINKKN
jgi:hypothetical protein